LPEETSGHDLMELFAVLKIHTTDEIWREKGNVVDILATCGHNRLENYHLYRI
jgi:hypothetical protein